MEELEKQLLGTPNILQAEDICLDKITLCEASEDEERGWCAERKGRMRLVTVGRQIPEPIMPFLWIQVSLSAT